MRIAAILLAGGDGNRFGGELPKQFLRLAGEEILSRSIRALASVPMHSMVVVAHPDWMEETERLVAAVVPPIPVRIVAGGTTRNRSTWNGLQALDLADDDVVVVHDAVRPLLPPDVLRRSIDPVVDGRADATDTVIPSADTLVIVERDDVTEIPDRSRFRRGQTPQVFRRGVLVRAYEAASAAGDLAATDDCSLVLRHVPGARVMAVAGDESNMKITTRLDMVMADRMIQLRTIGVDEPAGSTGSLEGARIVVVGGSQGIGRAVGEAAERLGARVVTLSRGSELDVRDPAAVRARLDAAAESLGGIDHVVVTAGVLDVGPSSAERLATMTEMIDVNLTGSLNVAVAARPHLARTRGSLTLFASSSFTRGRAGYVAYSASKAGVVNLAQGLADEWHADGIRVNAVSPERTDTPMRRRAFPDEPHAELLSADEVADATLRLLRSSLTGQVVDVRR